MIKEAGSKSFRDAPRCKAALNFVFVSCSFDTRMR